MMNIKEDKMSSLIFSLEQNKTEDLKLNITLTLSDELWFLCPVYQKHAICLRLKDNWCECIKS